jgi:hypothetical protein
VRSRSLGEAGRTRRKPTRWTGRRRRARRPSGTHPRPSTGVKLLTTAGYPTPSPPTGERQRRCPRRAASPASSARSRPRLPQCVAGEQCRRRVRAAAGHPRRDRDALRQSPVNPDPLHSCSLGEQVRRADGQLSGPVGTSEIDGGEPAAAPVTCPPWTAAAGALASHADRSPRSAPRPRGPRAVRPAVTRRR